MKTWAVWETEYPDDGSHLLGAWTKKGACRKYRKLTETRGGELGLPPLAAVEMTPAMLAKRGKVLP